MKKEKQIKSYQRKTKSGKMVTVKSHTAKYDAAEKAREAAKKKGAGKEFEERKKKPVLLEIPFDKEEEKKVLDDVKETDKKESTKKPAEKKTTKKVRLVGSGTKEPTPKRKSEAKVAKTTASKPSTSEPEFTTAEFKEWYRGTGSAADKKVAKALRAQLGRSGYRKLEDEAIDNYSSRGHLSLFKGLSGASATKALTTGTKRVTSKGEYTKGFTDFVTKHGYDINRYGVIKKGNEVQDRSVLDGFAKAYRSGSKVSFPKPKQTAVEKAYAQYHKEQGGKGSPNYSSEEFMDFASMYEHNRNSGKATKSKTVSRTKTSKKTTKSTTNKTSISPGGKPVPAREEGILTRAAKLPKGVSLKGGWHRVDASGTKGVGYSSWGSKADVYEAVLSNGKKAILKRTYGPAGEDKTTFE